MQLVPSIHLKSDKLLGLDISSTSIKLLELSHLSSGFHVDGYAIISLPRETKIDKSIKNSSSVSSTLARAIARIGSTTKSVALAVPDAFVITRIISLDKALNPKDMASRVALEAEKYIAYPVEELSLDFEVLGPNAKQQEFVDVLLVASHAKHVEARVDAVTDSGLVAVIVDVESYATARAVQGLVVSQVQDYQPELAIASIDIGATNTTVTVICNDEIIFNRTESFGGYELTRQIQEHYNLSYEEANLAKKLNSLSADYDAEILQPFRESLVLQIRRALQFYFSAEQHTEISTIVLSGGTARLPELAEMMAEQTGISTIIANPFAKMTFAPTVNTESLLNDAPSLLVCCGLAMRPYRSWYRE